MKQSNENIIYLEDHRVAGAKVFTGRDRGKKVRIDSEIDEVERKFSTVKIIIPDNIYSINPSFFEELFVNVVLKLGKENFLEKFIFESLGDYNYEKPLNEAIDRILRKRNALG
ncbi:DUF4325 domain-containing protein [Chitinophaga sp. CC14]|uniref:STAS-like domain-containing protein n=1 Tax=Chitinophaga sp. CC14 TaxID=3029199 RepID=UPI003B829ED6